MSKRRLSRQQTRRIDKSQRRLEKRARDNLSSAEQALAAGTLGEERDGLIIAQYGDHVDLLDNDRREHRCFLRANLETPVAGDRVTFQPGEDHGVVVATSPRRTSLRRPDKFGKLRTVAANIDQVLIVVAPLPEPHNGLIDRYLTAAAHLGARSRILLNKSDLLDDPLLGDRMTETLEPYPALGYEPLHLSAKAGIDDALGAVLAGSNSILVGQSGVGKTTILNALLPDAAQRVGDLSAERSKGKHTTTTARLFPLAGGGAVIDSPGIREFGLWHLEPQEVELGFPELQRIASQCRFRNCRHGAEPGCALEEAVARGEMHPARLDSYRTIINSLGDVNTGE